MQLPDGVVEYLQSHRTFEYDVEESELGAITLRRPDDLSESVIQLQIGRQKAAQDPYAGIDGRYQVTSVDIVADAEEFDPIGLLAWLPTISSFACIDAEHGTILSFGTADFQEIVANPLLFLESQWGPPAVGQYILPWEHFAFLVSDGRQFQPYGDDCHLHGEEVTRSVYPRSDQCASMRQHHLSEWLAEVALFPCCGVPNSDGNRTACPECARLEDQWAVRMADSEPTIFADVDSNGWVTCPGCRRRFQPTDKAAFRDNRHRCGQKITVRR